MLIRFIAVIVLATLITNALWPITHLHVYGIVVLVGLGIYGLHYFGWFKLPQNSKPPSSSDDEKVVSLDEFRRKKQQEAKKEKRPREKRMEVVFASNFVTEADLVAAMLEQHDIPTRVLNRQNATILIHPMGEFTVKVLVPREYQEQALKLIQQHQSNFPSNDSLGEDSSK